MSGEKTRDGKSHWSMLLGPCKHGRSPVTRCDEEDCPEANAFEQYLREYSGTPGERKP